MIDLRTAYEDLFDDPRISYLRMKAGTERHIDLLIVNNGDGFVTALLVEIQSAYSAYFGDMVNIDQAILVQKSKTAAKNTLEGTFLREVRKLEGLVVSVFEKDSDEYRLAFPQGLTEYDKANDAQRTILMERLKAFTAANVADFGQPKADLFAAILLNYTAAASAQGQKIGAVATERTERHVSRKNLTLQLTRDFHFIGFSFPGNPDRCMDFFDQSKFLLPGHAKSYLLDESLMMGQIKLLIIEDYILAGKDEANMVITSPNALGKQVVIYFGYTIADQPMPGEGVILDGNIPQSIIVSNIPGYAPGKLPLAKNTGMGDVDFEIEIVVK